jgi:hypothetical protein
MNDELPRCKLCGSEFRAIHDQSCRLAMVILTEDEWRRLHGPQPEMTGARLGDVLVRAGVIDAAAVEDPDGYDGGATVNALAVAARELTEHWPRLARETLRRLRDIAELMDQCGAFTDSHGEQQDHADDAAAIRAALAALGEE